MGLLDDAIREHLDLKRRHGAAEDEVARQEQEALGPPRQGEVPVPLQSTPAAAEPEAAPEREPEPAAAPDLYADEPWAEHAAPAPEAPTAAPEPEPEPTAGPGGSYAAPAPAPAEGEEEDVLEETPEFLQETPEHDRLWFEQKPPKDFDFDR